MDKMSRGIWIINTTKHITDAKRRAIELNCFETTTLAGKSGIFLSKLIADNQEVLSFSKVRYLARDSGIDTDNRTIKMYLDGLKSQGKVDYTEDKLGKIKEVEIYCFSNEDAIKTTASIYERELISEDEDINIEALEETYNIPRKRDELIEMLTDKGYNEDSADLILKVQETFGLVKAADDILYNEYTLNGNEEKIKKAISNLSSEEKGYVEEALNRIRYNQGLVEEKLSDIKPEMLKMMEGVGLIDGMTVKSDFGEATFFTTPHLKGKGIGSFCLSHDIFHKAKILLSCLRFGQEKSVYGRGKIDTRQKMINIIRKLNRGEWLKPNTACGQDYKLLEIDGVVEVKEYGHNMYQMRLRQKEVGVLVEQMVINNSIDGNPLSDASSPEIQPSSVIIPELRRNQILAKDIQAVEELKQQMFNSIRI